MWKALNSFNNWKQLGFSCLNFFINCLSFDNKDLNFSIENMENEQLIKSQYVLFYQSFNFYQIFRKYL